MNQEIAIKIRSQVCKLPCTGLCQETSKVVDLTRYVGNSETRTRLSYRMNMEKGLACECRDCSNRYFKIAEVLDHHLDLLRSRARHDTRGAENALMKRDKLLAEVGYKFS